MSRQVLVLYNTCIHDQGVERVVSRLKDRGVITHLFDTSRFPLDLRVQQTLDDDWIDGVPVPLSTIDAVWYRHFGVGEQLGDRVEDSWRPAIIQQSEMVVWALTQGVRGLHVDHPDRLDAVPGTPGILRLGRAAGLDVPRTLVSNHPEAVRRFVASCPDGAIRKMIQSSGVLFHDEDGVHHGNTVDVSQADLEDDAAIAVCPVIWQEKVPKQRELRVTAVGRELFVASVDSTGSASGATDWRQDRALVGGFEADTLPVPVADAVHRLLDRLQLNFATLDIIRTPDGRHVLLEVNTISFFDFVEQSTGLPIADSLAALLAGERPARMATEAR